MNFHNPHSYRDDQSVPVFDDEKPLIIFDGHCVLCSSGVQWMMKHDPNGKTLFAAIQEDVPRALYRHYDLDPDTFDTFMVLADGEPHIKWRGVLKAGQLMPPPWRWFAWLGRLIPSIIGDRIYDWVQRNRIGWFGAHEVCFASDQEMQNRLLQNKFTE